jgi:hypothetical protein
VWSEALARSFASGGRGRAVCVRGYFGVWLDAREVGAEEGGVAIDEWVRWAGRVVFAFDEREVACARLRPCVCEV